MGHPADPEFVALHTVRLKSFVTVEVLAAATDFGLDEAQSHLHHLVARGLLERREGRLAGWHLTPAGARRDQDLIDEELETGVDRAAIERQYQRFLALNPRFLEACTAWQLRPGGGPGKDAVPVLNDHADAGHDRSVIAQLAVIDEAAQPVAAALAAILERFGTYGPRLAAARARLEAGENDWFTKPVIESYHTVWFEWHEDLLCTLGIERSKEGHA